MRYFFHVGYNGFKYRGWQRLPQTNGENLQGIFESQLGKVLKSQVEIVGCGRTDAQVHAAQFFFHVDLHESWDYDLLFRLNKNLPPDLGAFEIIPVADKAHARFDAFSRTYNYFGNVRHDPFLESLSSNFLGGELKFDVMARAITLLPKYNDYAPFSKNVAADRSTVCGVTHAALYTDTSGDRFRFEISSNRFLNGMIRIIVNKLVMIGRGELTVDEFESYLAANTKPRINRLAPPQGLYLSKVLYPYIDLPPGSSWFRAMTEERAWLRVG